MSERLRVGVVDGAQTAVELAPGGSDSPDQEMQAMVTDLPTTVAKLREKIMLQRLASTAPAESRQAAELQFITDALLLLLEQREQKPK
jgi:hypothetical protein